MQRFLLNLKQLSRQPGEGSAAAGPPGSSLSFRVPSGFLGNLGEPLEYGPAEEPDDDINEEELGDPAQERHGSN